MRGKKARAIRQRQKAELTPSLRQERRERVQVLAIARNTVCNEAREEFEVGVAALRSAKNTRQNEAYAKFNEQRAAVRADIDAKAEKFDTLAESA